MIFRQSHFILAIRLLALEVVLFFLYLVVRIPKTLLVSSLNSVDLVSAANWIGILWFFLITIFELALAVMVIMQWASEEYEIKEGVIYHRRGIFQRDEDGYSLRDLGSATLSQSVMGRIFGFGTIRFFSPMLKHEFYLHNVHNPQEKLSSIENVLKEKNTGRIIPRRN
jgi:uncharacterized membrane protein YdbT with pleckstrin-like domain